MSDRQIVRFNAGLICANMWVVAAALAQGWPWWAFVMGSVLWCGLALFGLNQRDDQ